jgi:hypothetical protein
MAYGGDGSVPSKTMGEQRPRVLPCLSLLLRPCGRKPELTFPPYSWYVGMSASSRGRYKEHFLTALLWLDCSMFTVWNIVLSIR